MSPEEALDLVAARFPFSGYIHPAAGSHRNIGRTVQRHLSPGAKILDFGSGPCDKTAVLQLMGYTCAAFDDLKDEWVRDVERAEIETFCHEMGIGFEVATEDKPLPAHPSESFDMLMLHDVLEHLHDSPRPLLVDLLGLVKAEGLLYVTVPSAVNVRKRLAVLRGETNAPAFDAYYWARGPWRGHVREYTKRDLNLLAGYLELEVLELRSCHHMLTKVPRPLRFVYRKLTRIVPGWADSWQLVARKKPSWSPMRDLPDEEYARYRWDWTV